MAAKAGRGITTKLDAAERAKTLRKGPQCTVCALPKPVLAWVDGRIRSGAIKATLARVLQAQKYNIRPFTVQQHAREHVK